MKMKKRVFSAQVNGKHRKKIVKRTADMKSVWREFNRYAKSRGFTKEVIDEKYLGLLAWKNDEGEIMELVEVE